MEVIDLNGRKGLVIGTANEHSLAWWAAKHLANAGAELAITYLNEKAKPFVAPLGESIGAPILEPCNVSVPGQLEAVFDTVRARWGRLDFAFHSIAWARKVVA
jgi:enoyl-[acyl-carrier protein] reductase I